MSTHRLRIGSSGLLLVSHLAAYGLAAALEVGGERAFVGCEADSPELEPFVLTSAPPERAVECVRASALACREVVDADIAKDRPAIWARFVTEKARAPRALQAREQLLDGVQHGLSARLVAGLGAPMTWGGEKATPAQGATRLDGVAGNSTSDFVRGVLRRTRPAAEEADRDELLAIWAGDDLLLGAEHKDRTGWGPPGIRVHLAHQWLAALGLGQLPVGLTTRGSRTPCCFKLRGEPLTVQLPVCSPPASAPRLRALLARSELASPELHGPPSARLRALGVPCLVRFQERPAPGRNRAGIFTFARGEPVDLA
ncbi:MAG TPA: hypothetical protein VKV27_10750 [Solirubrobacteraceae bacterium]|nr:hypothetical protein [Solirubrobacteraceae bacterium]